MKLDFSSEIIGSVNAEPNVFLSGTTEVVQILSTKQVNQEWDAMFSWFQGIESFIQA